MVWNKIFLSRSVNRCLKDTVTHYTIKRLRVVYGELTANLTYVKFFQQNTLNCNEEETLTLKPLQHWTKCTQYWIIVINARIVVIRRAARLSRKSRKVATIANRPTTTFACHLATFYLKKKNTKTKTKNKTKKQKIQKIQKYKKQNKKQKQKQKQRL